MTSQLFLLIGRTCRCIALVACCAPLVAGIQQPPPTAPAGVVPPDQNLPPHIRQLTGFGERADFSLDGKRVLFVSKTFGDAMEIDLATGVVRNLTAHFPHFGFTRALYLANGQILLSGPTEFDPANVGAARTNCWLFILDPTTRARPQPLGVKAAEGPVPSRKRMHIAWSYRAAQFPGEMPPGSSQILEGDIEYVNGVPKLTHQRKILDSRDLPFTATLEPQNFRPPQERELIFSAYDYQQSEAFGVDLTTGKLTNYSNGPGIYDEPEGIFPSGEYTTVESDKHNPAGKGFDRADIHKLKLDGSGAMERLTFFADVPTYRASNPVVSDDGRYMAFQMGRSGVAAGIGYGLFLYDFTKAPASKLAATGQSQTTRPSSLLLDRAYMTAVRARAEKGDAAMKAAIATLEQDAKAALAIAPMSVMDKGITPPSGDKHDYVSQAPYWWPDPSKPDGKPYIRKDGERNPEISKITDRDNLGRLGNAVTTLALAYAYTGREEYAAHAARLMRVWFLDPATRMNPHLEFGQYIPGINEGRGIGIIETRTLPDMLDAIISISKSPAWTTSDEAGLQAWMRGYLSWLIESTHGQEESKNGNNHETWYDVEVVGLALYTGQTDLARRTLEGSRARIGRQFEPDGRQPRELERTRSWDYSEFNIAAFMDLATLGQQVGIDLWNYRTADGRSIRQALDFMVSYAAGERKWTFDQITPFSASTIHRILRRGAVAWKEPKYKALAAKIGGGSPRLILTIP